MRSTWKKGTGIASRYVDLSRHQHVDTGVFSIPFWMSPLCRLIPSSRVTSRRRASASWVKTLREKGWRSSSWMVRALNLFFWSKTGVGLAIYLIMSEWLAEWVGVRGAIDQPQPLRDLRLVAVYVHQVPNATVEMDDRDYQCHQPVDRDWRIWHPWVISNKKYHSPWTLLWVRQCYAGCHKHLRQSLLLLIWPYNHCEERSLKLFSHKDQSPLRKIRIPAK